MYHLRFVRWLPRHLDIDDSDEAVGRIDAVRGDGQIVIDAEIGVGKYTGDIYDVTLVCVTCPGCRTRVGGSVSQIL
jgi:hypothetical protein